MIPHVLIKIPDIKVKKVRDFVEEVIQAKTKEKHHKIDPRSAYKRFFTGTLGEVALECLLGVELVDWDVGLSSGFNTADLRKIRLDVGIKTVEHDKYPVIHKHPKRPEIILIKNKHKENEISLIGIASVDILKTYQNDRLIKDARLLARGTKTGLSPTALPFLKLFHNLEQLRSMAM
jgi:hypothetical protein